MSGDDVIPVFPFVVELVETVVDCAIHAAVMQLGGMLQLNPAAAILKVLENKRPALFWHKYTAL